MDGDKMFFDKKVEILMVDFVGFEKTVKVISYAKGLAGNSNNPIAKAISNMDPRIEPGKVEKTKEFKDFGLLGKIDNDTLLLGNEKIMRENNIKLNGDTNHKIFFAINDQVQAVFRLND